MNFISELKRRNVIRMAGLYLVGAWLLTQVAATLLPVFGAPAWVMKALVAALAIGFFAALVFAWVFELTPEGLKRDADVPDAVSIAPQTGRRMDRAIIGVLVLALVYFAVDKFVLAPGREAAQIAATSAAAPATAPATTPAVAAPAVDARSIAVLPFVNMSADPENEFFSDGLSEEILNSLARIDGMQVVGRTSSFQFKGKNEDLRKIGEALGVATVLEGSVRREGERARITAQLIRTRDGIHLWSQTYDRTLKDTFAVQLDIAEQVAGVLQVVLDDKQRERMRTAGVKDVEAFIAYQKGLKLYTAAHRDADVDLFEGLRAANAEFDRAIAIEPDFFEPHFAKADLYEHGLQANDRSPAEHRADQQAALETLRLAAAHSKDEQQRLLTRVERQMLSDDWRGLSGLIDQAFQAPGCHASNWAPVFASAFGYGDAINDFGVRATTCDPLNGINLSTRVTAALANGQAKRALAVGDEINRSVPSRPVSAGTPTAIAQAMLGQLDAADATLDALGKDQNTPPYAMARTIVDRARGQSPAEIRASLASLERHPGKFNQWLMADAVVAANLGDRAAANRYAAAMDARPAGGFLLANFSINCHCGAPFDLDATPNFKQRLAESGLRWPPPATMTTPPAPAQ